MASVGGMKCVRILCCASKKEEVNATEKILWTIYFIGC